MFKDLYSNNTVNKSFGIIENASIDFLGPQENLDNRITFIKDPSGLADFEFLKESIKQRGKRLPRGVYVSYNLGNSRKLTNYFETLDKLTNIVTAFRIITGGDCDCTVYMDYDDSGAKPVYYSPFDISEPLGFAFADNKLAKLNRPDIMLFKKIITPLDKFSLGDTEKFNRLKNAVGFYNAACGTRAAFSQLINFFIALESVFGDGEGEISYKLRVRAAYFTYPDVEDVALREGVFKFLSIAYGIRSAYVHGDDVEKCIKSKFKTNTMGLSHNYVPRLRNILDMVLKRILTNERECELFSSKNKECIDYLDSIVLRSAIPKNQTAIE